MDWSSATPTAGQQFVTLSAIPGPGSATRSIKPARPILSAAHGLSIGLIASALIWTGLIALVA